MTDVPMRDMSRAMDEIYLLRAVSAREALRVRNEEIPRAKSHRRRAELLELAEGLERAACGQVAAVWSEAESPQRFLAFAGAPTNLNYPTWKAEHE